MKFKIANGLIDVDLTETAEEQRRLSARIGDAIRNFECIGMPGTLCPPWCRGCFAKKLWRKWHEAGRPGLRTVSA